MRISLPKPIAIACLTVTMAAVGTLTPAAAATTDYAMSGSASATYINVLSGVVESGPTSTSQLNTVEVPAASTNTLATVDVGGLIHAEALSTEVATSVIADGQQVTSTAKAAEVRLLNGLIRLNGITTTSTARVVNDLASYSGDTELLGLVINNKKIPVTVGHNTKIEVPGIVRVVVNQTEGQNTSDSGAVVRSAGIEVTLLRPFQTYKKGTVVVITPTTATIGPKVPVDGPALGGLAYVLKAQVNVANSVKVLAGPVAAHYLAGGGTAGQTVEQGTVKVNLSPIAKANVVGTEATGSRRSDFGSAEMTAKVTGLSLLNGIITADVVRASSAVSRDAGADQPTRDGSVTLVGLKINGKPVGLDPSPNTKLAIPGVGTLTLNQQVEADDGLTVRALDLVLGKPLLGLPVGAHVEVSVAIASVSK